MREVANNQGTIIYFTGRPVHRFVPCFQKGNYGAGKAAKHHLESLPESRRNLLSEQARREECRPPLMVGQALRQLGL